MSVFKTKPAGLNHLLAGWLFLKDDDYYYYYHFKYQINWLY